MKMMMRMRVLCVVSLFILSLFVANGASQKGVKVSLHAKWPGTPLLHEAAEFLASIFADESPTAFWEFVRGGWTSPSPSNTKHTCLDSIIDAASTHLSPRMTQLLRMSLALRQYSPRLETFRQLAIEQIENQGHRVDETCFVTVDGVISRNIEEVKASLAKAKKTQSPSPSALYPIDHISITSTPSSSSSSLTGDHQQRIPLIVYGAIGDECATAFDKQLQNIAENDETVIYAWRLISLQISSNTCFSLGTQEELSLSGYGVELAIKNMEYNARDDSKTKTTDPLKTEKDDDTDIDNDLILNGFKFSSLIKNNPSSEQELLRFRKHLLSSSTSESQSLLHTHEDSMSQIKAWSMSDFGLQAVQGIINADDPLLAFQEVSQNFPMLAHTLSRTVVNETIRDASTEIYRRLFPGTNYLVLNGLLYDTDDFHLYKFVHTLRREIKLMDCLALIGLDPSLSRETAFLRGSRGDGGSLRLRLLPSADAHQVVWSNNIETDAAYQRLPRSMASLLQPGFMGQMPSIRRNIFTAVFMFDPATEIGMMSGSVIYTAIANGFPVRFGIMPVSPAYIHGNTDADSDFDSDSGEISSSEKIRRTFAMVASHFGGRKAAEYMALIAHTMKDMTTPYPRNDQKAFADVMWPVAERVLRNAWDTWSGRKGPSSSSSMYDDDDDEYDVDDDNNNDSSQRDSVDVGVALESALHQTGTFGEYSSTLLKESTTLSNRAGLSSSAVAQGVLVLNGIVSLGDESSPSWKSLLIQVWQEELATLQQDIYMGRLGDESDDILEDILTLYNAVPSYNSRVLSDQQQSSASRYSHLVAAASASSAHDDEQHMKNQQEEIKDAPYQLHLLDALAGTTGSLDKSKYNNDDIDNTRLGVLSHLPIHYFSKESDSTSTSSVENRHSVITHWVVVDVESPHGRYLLSEALQYITAGTNTNTKDGVSARLGIIINPQKIEYSTGNKEHELPLTPTEELVVALSSNLIDSATTADILDIVMQLASIPKRKHSSSSSSSSGKTSDTHETMTYTDISKMLPENMGNDAKKLLSSKILKITSFAEQTTFFLRNNLKIRPGTNAVITNGRVVVSRYIGDITADTFLLLDVNAMRNQYANVFLHAVVSKLDMNERALSDMALVVSDILMRYSPHEADSRVHSVVGVLHELYSSPLLMHIPSESSIDESTAPLLVQGIFDPLTKSSQQFSGILSFLRDFLSPDSMVLLFPGQEYTELPLKTFYRYVTPTTALDTTLNKKENNKNDNNHDSIDANARAKEFVVPTTEAIFSSLPTKKTLTLGMDVPEAWLVQPVVAKYDLDNLRLEELSSLGHKDHKEEERFAEARFELEALLVTGMCMDATAVKMQQRDIHPRGVQLQLGTSHIPAVVDTLVMSNLGYYQLKAAPGVWQLRLTQGRSSEVYAIAASSGASMAGGTSPSHTTSTTMGYKSDSNDEGGADSIFKAPLVTNKGNSTSVPVAVTSFTGKHMLLVLRKHADRINEDVLDESSSSTSMENGDNEKQKKTTSMWSAINNKNKNKQDGVIDVGDIDAKHNGESDEMIHVFTVASGHMYERLQKIMILSAIKRTKHRVKFWFIKNYMSPQMKDFLPIMAKEYDFEYEFVTYKWPSWLHKQTEKQRIIWAYKILFLDVLFPLGLKKVIFCDSDQVIRADLYDLWTMDLQGAPYGYTPFCDTNKDMEGFRFWKTGFWKEHLKGKPYHISALYVVDLERFRQLAAGDKLRVIYDGLSKDPNSLSNLDQDLPNYSQDLVPIFSLPQQWLWCETWCGEASRPEAKTIDLCNNPLTKEPKLQSARRIIKEWPDLNREVEEFSGRVEKVLSGEEQNVGSDRFMTYLKPMVEGSIKTHEGSSGGSVEKEVVPDSKVPSTHDATEL